jgi:LuxR family maltose regulon positive regulatory protein
MATILDKVEALLAQMPLPAETANPILGEVYLLRGAILTAQKGHLQETLTNAQHALELLPSDWHYATTAAKMTVIASYHMLGDPDRAYAQLYDLLDKADFEDKTSHATLLLYINCVLHWVDADLPALMRVASRYLEIGQRLKLPESIAVANGFLGVAHYQRNNLAVAERYLATTAGSVVYKVVASWYVQGTLALAQTYLALDRQEQARETVEKTGANLLEIQSNQLLPVVEAFQAELSLNQGHITQADRWAKQYNPLPLMLMHRFYVPQLTLVKVWLAQDTETSREQAADLLTRLQAFIKRTHSTRYLIEVLALQAMLDDAQGHQSAALAKLEQAIHLAEPGGFIRLFVDLGPKLLPLLNQLRHRNVTLDYITQILSAFGTDGRPPFTDHSGQPSAAGGLLEPLTEREFEILMLLAQRLSNKEIAVQLMISSGTVTQHTHNIYQKLNVKGRRQAVGKATELGILTPA